MLGIFTPFTESCIRSGAVVVGCTKLTSFGMYFSSAFGRIGLDAPPRLFAAVTKPSVPPPAALSTVDIARRPPTMGTGARAVFFVLEHI